ncbi:DNA topoisomerase [Helicobacter pylori]|uniref:DNA topoisomerase n=1 Tax=Helicobacter pylori TaxID=210 RepID=UPI002159E072
MQKVASRHTGDSNKFNIKPKEKIDENVINALETSLKSKGVVSETLESIKEAKNNKEYENLSNRGFLRAKLDQGVWINFQESLGYNLSALQKKAISLLKISPNQILELVQKLYMKGHISYPTEYLFEEIFKKNLYKIYKDSENDCFNKNVADEEKVLLEFPSRKFTPNEFFTAALLTLNAMEFCLYINLKKKETNV